MNNKNFENFMNEYLSNIELYTKSYVDVNRNNKKIIVLIILSFFVIYFLLFFGLNIYKLNILLNVLFFILLLFIYVYFIFKVNGTYNKNISNDVNKLLYLDMLSFFTNKSEKTFLPDKRLKQDYFSNSNIFNLNKFKYNGENFTKISFLNKSVILSDIIIYNYKYKTTVNNVYDNGVYYKVTKNRKIPNTLYKGLYIEIPNIKNDNSFVYIIPNNFDNLVKNKLNNIVDFNGERVELENPSFEKFYNVYSNNQINARCILTLSKMEDIVNIENIIKNEKIFVFREDGNLSIFVEDFTLDKLLNQKIKLDNGVIDQDYLLNFYNSVSKVFKLIDVFIESKK